MKSRLKYAGLGAALATATTAGLQAEVKINEHLSISGYAVAAGTITDPDSGTKDYTLADSGASNYDAAKIALTGTYENVSGTVSLFYVPQTGTSTGDGGILDAFVTYTAGPVSVTAGKYLSYLGFEAFDPVNMTQITYATISGIPAYHTGAKVDYAGDGFSAGVSVTDSLQPGDGFFQGDGEFSDDVGFEAFVTFTGIDKLTLFTGIGYEDTDGAPDSTFVLDVWASYELTDAVTVAAEYTYNKDVAKSALAFVQYTFSDKLSAIARASVIDVDGGDTGSYFTVSPTYAFNDYFALRAEVSYADSAESGGNTGGDKGFFYGVQGVFKF
jgi:hypothetical protein